MAFVPYSKERMVTITMFVIIVEGALLSRGTASCGIEHVERLQRAVGAGTLVPLAVRGRSLSHHRQRPMGTTSTGPHVRTEDCSSVMVTSSVSRSGRMTTPQACSSVFVALKSFDNIGDRKFWYGRGS
jgi:hypothetical protein